MGGDGIDVGELVQVDGGGYVGYVEFVVQNIYFQVVEVVVGDVLQVVFFGQMGFFGIVEYQEIVFGAGDVFVGLQVEGDEIVEGIDVFVFLG